MASRTVQPDGKAIVPLRTERGWSQADLADRADCSIKTIENAESGRPIYRKTLAILAEAFDVDVATLLPGEDASSNRPAFESASALPPPPKLLIGREAEIAELIQRLTPPADTGTATVQVLTAIRGWPGIGKTTLATAIAHHEQVTSLYPDGALWASLGPTPDVISHIAAWGRTLGSDQLAKAKSVDEASQQLGGLLRDRRMLLIVDDVWSVADAMPLQVGGSGCGTLVTTRDSIVAEQLASTPGDIYRADPLDEEQSLELLGKLCPSAVEEHPDECRKLVAMVEGSPLAIQVAGRLLNTEARRGWGIADLLESLSTDIGVLLEEQAPADRTDLITQTTPTIAALLRMSTDRLDNNTRERFAYLGASAPKPATFGLDILTRVWEVDDAVARRTVNELADRGLVEPVATGRFQMHALLVALADSLCTDDEE